MNIVFISRCSGKSINRTRRVLDSFTARKGDSTWNGSLTKEALKTVLTELKQGASKTTAIGVYNANSKESLKLIQVIGKRDAFDTHGNAPIRKKKAAKSPIESAPFALRSYLTAIAMLAGLTHDTGKASVGFQNKLRSSSKEHRASAIRHELASVQIASAMLKNGKSWHEAWKDFEASCLRQKTPFSHIDNSIDLVMAMVLTHHRLMGGSIGETDSDYLLEPYLTSGLEHARADDARLFDPEWQPFDNDVARDLISKIGRNLAGDVSCTDLNSLGKSILGVELNEAIELAIPALFHLGRTVLQLSDHRYSRQGTPGDTIKSRSPNKRVFANSNNLGLNQPLDEHLAGVARGVERSIQVTEMARFGLKGISPDEIGFPGEVPKKFKWQQDSAELAATTREKHPFSGIIAFATASTGHGKTAGCFMVGANLSFDSSSRLVVTSPMRNLTRQHHEDYAKNTMVNPSDLALAVGGIYLNPKDEERIKAQHTQVRHSDSSMEDDLEVLASREFDIPTLIRECVGDNEKVINFLGAPILCCTIDYINRAAEPHRGSHLLAYLRLISSDVIIDESGDVELAAIRRIAQIVGLAGRNLIISTATMTAQAIAHIQSVYRKGFLSYATMRGIKGDVQTLLLSESNQTHIEDCDDILKQTTAIFQQRVESAKATPAKRIGEILKTNGKSREDAFKAILGAIKTTHERHSNHVKVKDKTISVGLVRLERVKDCVALAEFIRTHASLIGMPIKILMNHGGFTNAERAYKYRTLSNLLKRSGEKDAILEDPDVLSMLQSHKDSAVAIITTSVGERGNDYDFDWAITEPTSISSMIQLAGRVGRHRQLNITQPNFSILQYPVNPGKGFRNDIHEMKGDDITVGVCDEFLKKIDSRALLGDESLAHMPLLQVGLKHRLLNDKDFLKNLEKTSSNGHIGIAASSFYKPPLRSKQKQHTIEIDENGEFLDSITGHAIAIGYKKYDDEHFDDLMFGAWRRSDVYSIVFDQCNMPSWQRKIGRQVTHSVYEEGDDMSPFVCSDALGLFKP